MENKFLLLTKINFLRNWKVILIFLITYMGIFFMSGVTNESYKYTNLSMNDARALGWLSMLLYVLISLSFSEYFTKTATMSVTLPAKSATKFLVILFQAFVIYPLLIFAVYVINHYLRGVILNETFDFGFIYKAKEWLNILIYCGIFFATSIFFGRLALFYGLGFILLSSWVLWGLFAPDGSDYRIVIGRLYDVGYQQLPQIIFLVLGMFYLTWWKFKRLKIK